MSFAIDIYRRLISVQIRSQLQYRVNFLIDVLATALITATVFISLAFIFERFGNIAGWKLAEIAFLYGFVESAFGVMDMIFSGFDPQNFGNQTRLGRFDQLLLRPVNITVQVVGSEFILRRLGRIFQGLFILFIAMQSVHINWTFGKVLYIPIVFASMVCFFGGLFVIGATMSFWTVESLEVVNIFTYGGAEMMSYPMNIYPDRIRQFFTYIVPAIFLVYYPALYLLDKPDPLGMPSFAPFLAPLVGFGMLILASFFWRYGIRHYQSTGT
jgi:ABC-2 type transport system permease protein